MICRIPVHQLNRRAAEGEKSNLHPFSKRRGDASQHRQRRREALLSALSIPYRVVVVPRVLHIPNGS